MSDVDSSIMNIIESVKFELVRSDDENSRLDDIFNESTSNEKFLS
jgi:hypothetical protein